MKTSGIYRITSPTGRVYIGQSWNIENRKKYYRTYSCKTQFALYNSLKKYGYENHLFEVIHVLNENCTQEQLNKLEYDYWKQMVDLGMRMLNSRIPDGRGGKLTEETKRRISEKLKGTKKGKKLTKDHCLKISLGKLNTKMNHTNETKEKMSLAKKGKYLGINNPSYGRKGVRGENSPNSKFTESQVREIWTLYNNGIKQSDIVKLFNSNKATINAIVKGRIWKHITGLQTSVMELRNS